MDLKNNQGKLTLAVILVSIMLVLLLKWTAPETSPEMKPLPKARVELHTIQKKDVSITEYVSGRLVPVRRTQLKFEVSGRLAARLVEAGQRVEQGQVLLEIDDRDYHDIALDAGARLDEEKAAIGRDRRLLELARENRDLQQNEVKRQERLLKKSLTSQSSLDSARQQLSALQREVSRLQYSVDSAAARLQIREAAWQRAQRDLQRCRLQSPWTGIVNQVFFEQGDSVSPSQVAIELIDNSRLEFLLNLPGAIAHHLAIDDAVEVMVDDRRVEAHIVAVQTDPDPATFTHEVRVRLPQGSGRAGDMVQAKIVLPPQEQAVVVPVTALQYQDGKQYVMRYTDGTVSRRLVEIAERVDNEQIIMAGVDAGEVIVSRDVASLSDGQAVEVIGTVE